MVLGVWMITSAHQISITARQTLALFARTQQEATHVNVTLAPLLLTELANATKGFMSVVELALTTMNVKQAIMRVLFTKFAPTLLEVTNACANRVTVMQHVQIQMVAIFAHVAKVLMAMAKTVKISTSVKWERTTVTIQLGVKIHKEALHAQIQHVVKVGLKENLVLRHDVIKRSTKRLTVQIYGGYALVHSYPFLETIKN